MEKNPSKSDELVPRTEDRKMSRMCLLNSEMAKSSCTVDDLVSKVVAGSSDVCDDVVKEEYEICDTNGFSNTVLCGEEVNNMMPLEYVKVELTEENSETYIQKTAGRQEELSHKDGKSCTSERKSSSVTSGEKASNIANQASSESVEGSTGSKVKVQVNSSTEKRKVTENKDSSGNR